MDNIFALHNDLAAYRYNHGSYQMFRIADPKPRVIHKATVRDRVLHHAIYRILYPFFDRTFIPDSFSCRIGKGTHHAIERFRAFAYHASSNHTRTLWVLHCDIRKCFASIDQRMLIATLHEYIADEDVRWLLRQVIESFSSGTPHVGLPLGNLTSQLFANIYLNTLDQFVKHRLKAKYYLRYSDDFIFCSADRDWLLGLISQLRNFLAERLHLELHPKKITLKSLASGADILGWVHFTDHRVLRTATKHRMFRRIQEHPTEGTLQSYRGLLSHGNARHPAQFINSRGKG